MDALPAGFVDRLAALLLPAGCASNGAEAALAAAELCLAEIEAHRNPAPALISLASLLARLAAEFLLIKDFPALPGGLLVLLDRDRSRLAGRDLARCLDREQRLFERGTRANRDGSISAAALTDLDRRLAQDTGQTLRELHAVRVGLMEEFLRLRSDFWPSAHGGVAETALVSLVAAHWRASGRLPQIERERRPRESLFPLSSDQPVAAALHPPRWRTQVTVEEWEDFLDQGPLLWSDPAPQSE
jgi:hypothetical protein